MSAFPVPALRRLRHVAFCLSLSWWASCAAAADDGVDILSSQFGVFDDSTPGELSFLPTTVVPRVVGQRYGWIIEVKTAKRSLSVREEYVIPLPAAKDDGKNKEADEFLDGFRQPPQRRNQVSQRQLVPVGGQIYGEWFVGQNEPAGHRRLQVFVEGRPAATFEYDVR